MYLLSNIVSPNLGYQLEDRVYTIHIGGSPDGPEVPGFDSETCEKIWNLFRSKETEIWGRKGLGVVTVADMQMGYDLHVLFQPEGSEELLDCWMWRDSVEYITSWRRWHTTS